MKNNILNIIYTVSILFILVTSLSFGKTKGLLVASEQNEEIYVNELYSSGSDDNIIISFGFFFSLLLLLNRVIKWKKSISNTESYIAFGVCILQAVLIVTLIEVGGIVKTITTGQNYVLFLWILSYICLFSSSLVFLVRKKWLI